MVEQVIFKIDRKLKDRAMKKAKKEGTTYSDVLRFATDAFLDNRFEVGFVYSPKLIKEVLKSKKEKTLYGDLDELVNLIK